MNVFEFARGVESNGQRFYGEMAARAREKGVRNIFGRLAEDEARLLTDLRRLETRYGTDGRESPALDAGSNIFAELREREAQLRVVSDLDAYRLAKEAEAQIVGQYRAAIEREHNPEVKALLERVAALEAHELDEIEHLSDFVDAPNHSLEWGEFSNLGEFHNFGRYEG